MTVSCSIVANKTYLFTNKVSEFPKYLQKNGRQKLPYVCNMIYERGE